MSFALAQIGPERLQHLDSLHERFSTPVPGILYDILLVLSLLTLLLAVVSVLGRVQRQRRSRELLPQPMAVFRRASAGMGLSRVDRFWLWRLAAVTNCAHPTVLLISAVHFDAALASYAAGGGLLAARALALPRLEAVRSRLFGRSDLPPSGLAAASL